MEVDVLIKVFVRIFGAEEKWRNYRRKPKDNGL